MQLDNMHRLLVAVEEELARVDAEKTRLSAELQDSKAESAKLRAAVKQGAVNQRLRFEDIQVRVPRGASVTSDQLDVSASVDRVRQLEEEVQDLRTLLGSSSTSGGYAELQSTIADLRSKLAVCKNKLAESERECLRLRDTNRALERQLGEFETTIQEHSILEEKERSKEDVVLREVHNKLRSQDQVVVELRARVNELLRNISILEKENRYLRSR